MKINFYATLRAIVGQKTVDLALPEQVTVQGLIDRMVTTYPGLRRELLDDNGNLYPHVHLFINGRDAPYLDQGLATRVELEDTVSVFPAVGGGAG
jgi:molybdopterin synthase sulfur carrier subunit